MKRRLIRAMLAVAVISGVITAAVPAHADPCDVHVKNVYLDLINCG